MKIRHGIIISIVLFMGAFITYNDKIPLNDQKLTNIILILWLISLGLIVYLIIRSIFRAVRRTATETPKRNTATPWEK